MSEPNTINNEKKEIKETEKASNPSDPTHGFPSKSGKTIPLINSQRVRSSHYYLEHDQKAIVTQFDSCELGNQKFFEETNKKLKNFNQKKTLVVFLSIQEKKNDQKHCIYEQILFQYLNLIQNYQLYETPFPLFVLNRKFKKTTANDEEMVISSEMKKLFAHGMLEFFLENMDLQMEKEMMHTSEHTKFKNIFLEMEGNFSKVFLEIQRNKGGQNEVDLENLLSEFKSSKKKWIKISQNLNNQMSKMKFCQYCMEDIEEKVQKEMESPVSELRNLLYVFYKFFDDGRLSQEKIKEVIENTIPGELNSELQMNILGYGFDSFKYKVLLKILQEENTIFSCFSSNIEKHDFEIYQEISNMKKGATQGLLCLDAFTFKNTVSKNEDQKNLQGLWEEIKTMAENRIDAIKNIRKIHIFHAFTSGIKQVDESDKQIEKRFFDQRLKIYCFLHQYFHDKYKRHYEKNSLEREGTLIQKHESRNTRAKNYLEKSEDAIRLLTNAQMELERDYLDFVSDAQEYLEKLTDGDINSCIFWKKLEFHEKTRVFDLHPMLAGVFGYFCRLKSYLKTGKKEKKSQKVIEEEKENDEEKRKKEIIDNDKNDEEKMFKDEERIYFDLDIKEEKTADDHFYNDHNLPKVTFVNLDGFDNPANYVLAKHFARNLQMISITIDNCEDSVEQIDKRIEGFTKIRTKKNVHYIPLRTGDQNYEIKSKDFWHIFNTLVFRLIENYNPFIIVLSYSFSFYKTIQENRANLNPNTFANIVHRLCLLSNYRLVFYPNIILKGVEPKLNYKPQFEQWKEKFAFKNNEELLRNRKYIYEIIGAFVNSVNGLTTKSSCKQNIIKDVNQNKAFHSDFNSILQKRFQSLSRLKLYTLHQYNANNKLKFLQKLIDQQKSVTNVNENIISSTNLNENQKETGLKEKNKNLKKPSYFLNYFVCYNPLSKAVETSKLKNKEESTNFYYNETTTIYLHDTPLGLLCFFFNVWSKDGIMRSYCSNFSITDIIQPLKKNSPILRYVVPISHYFQDNKQHLTDFSITGTKTKIYLIWGMIINTKSNSVKSLNRNIFCYSIQNDHWETISLALEEKEIRMKAASCVISKDDEDSIYIFGGMGFHPEYDIYNIVDCVVVVGQNDSKKIAQHYHINKKNYIGKHGYKPLNNSLIINATSEPNAPKFLMIGGTSSEFALNQKNKGFLACFITIKEKNTNPSETELEFNYFTREKTFRDRIKDPSNFESLNLLIAQSSKQFICKFEHNLSVPVWTAYPHINGLFLGENMTKITKSFLINESNELTTKMRTHEGNFLYHNKVLVLEFPFKKAEDFATDIIINTKRQFFAIFSNLKIAAFDLFLKKIDVDYILVSDSRPGLLFLSLKMANKGRLKAFEGFEADYFDSNHLEFSFPGLLKYKQSYPYPECTVSNLRISNFCREDDRIYILVNSPKDNDGLREVYSLDLGSIYLKSQVRIEPNHEYTDDSTFEVYGSSLIVNSNHGFLIGGTTNKAKMQDYQELTGKDLVFLSNRMIDLATKSQVSLPNNRKTFIRPYIVFLGNNVVCFDRLQKTESRFIYGETLCFNGELECENKWEPFQIMIPSCKLLRLEDRLEEEKHLKSEKIAIIRSFVPIGRKKTAEDRLEVLFIVAFDEVGNKGKLILRKRFVSLELNTLFLRPFNSTILQWEGLDDEDIMFDVDSCFYRIPDAGYDCNGENRLLYFNGDMSIVNCSKFERKIAKNKLL